MGNGGYNLFVVNAVTPIPSQFTPLIGRDDDIVAVSAFLRRSDVRLLTLTGAGGTGKTRLALALAEFVARDFSDGVAVVELVMVSDPGLVAPTIAQRLGIPIATDQSAEERLRVGLQRRSLLLVLDNFEHVLPAAPLVADLLGYCPGLRLLVTSRAPLRLREEQVYPVPPLAVPAVTLTPAPDLIGETAAVALFVERAARVAPGFTLTEENAAAVAEICRLLDGLPLALELAAARIRLLSPATLLERLGRRLPLLSGGARDLPARQRTLRDTIAWSYDLLDGETRRLLRQLAVFVGGWTIDAVEGVCPTDSDIDWIETLATLVDWSLVQRGPVADGEARFTMLETVREFALEQLTVSGEFDDAAQAHAEYYVTVAESADMDSPARATWLARFDREIGNLRAALSWTRRAPNGGVMQLRLATATAAFWGQRGYGVEGYAWTIEALERTEGDVSAIRAAGLLAAGHTAWGWRESTTARDLIAESLALYESLGDTHGRATALFHLGIVTMTLDDGRTALACIEEGNALVREIGSRWELARGITWLGFCHLLLGDLDSARVELTDGLSLFHELGDDDQAAMNLRFLGYIARERGDPAEAWRFTAESIDLNQRAGDRRGVATSAAALAGILLDRGQPEEAARLAGSAAAALERLGTYGVQPGDERHYLAIITSIRATLGDGPFEVEWSRGQAQPLDTLLDRLLEQSTTEHMEPATQHSSDLSSRELEVLRLLAAGKSNPEIANELVISRNTVYRHVSHIFTKLGVENRTEAAIYAERHGLI